MKTAVMEIVSQSFRPEFINRIDDTVVFHVLDQAQIAEIANIQLAILINRVKESRICLKVEDDALDLLVAAGYDPVYGARPLKRAIQQYMENPLAEALLSGKFVAGDAIRARKAKNLVVFEKI